MAVVFEYEKAKGERFGMIMERENKKQSPDETDCMGVLADTTEKDFISCMGKDDFFCEVYLATSPDWEKRAERKGLKALFVREDDIGDYAVIGAMWKLSERAARSILKGAPEMKGENWVLLTGTDEDFEEIEEPWVDDHTADDNGLLGISAKIIDGEVEKVAFGLDFAVLSAGHMTKVSQNLPYGFIAMDPNNEEGFNCILTGTEESFMEPDPEPVAKPETKPRYVVEFSLDLGDGMKYSGKAALTINRGD